MAELTREQIEDMRQFAINMCQYATERTSVAFGSAKFLVAVCDGALRALDQEADARLGAAVRAWTDGDSPSELNTLADVLAKPKFLGSERSPVVQLIREVAKAMREETPDADR